MKPRDICPGLKELLEKRAGLRTPYAYYRKRSPSKKEAPKEGTSQSANKRNSSNSKKEPSKKGVCVNAKKRQRSTSKKGTPKRRCTNDRTSRSPIAKKRKVNSTPTSLPQKRPRSASKSESKRTPSPSAKHIGTSRLSEPKSRPRKPTPPSSAGSTPIKKATPVVKPASPASSASSKSTPIKKVSRAKEKQVLVGKRTSGRRSNSCKCPASPKSPARKQIFNKSPTKKSSMTKESTSKKSSPKKNAAKRAKSDDKKSSPEKSPAKKVVSRKSPVKNCEAKEKNSTKERSLSGDWKNRLRPRPLKSNIRANYIFVNMNQSAATDTTLDQQMSTFRSNAARCSVRELQQPRPIRTMEVDEQQQSSSSAVIVDSESNMVVGQLGLSREMNIFSQPLLHTVSGKSEGFGDH